MESIRDDGDDEFYDDDDDDDDDEIDVLALRWNRSDVMMMIEWKCLVVAME